MNQRRHPPASIADTAPTELLDEDLLNPQVGSGPRALEQYVGTVLLGRFELVEFIGKGGMSGVFKAVDRRKVEGGAANPHVAVKLLALSFADHSAALAVLQREAAKLQSLAHPNIVRAIDCDRDGEIVFMTMEYIEGVSLAKKLGEPEPLKPAAAAKILERCADALTFAHSHGILHADFKPGNVLVTRDGEVKVIDFGIARAMATFDQSRLKPKHDSGHFRALTPAYASPEMLQGGEPDARDDVYALACVAHEMLTAEHPFNHWPATNARDSGLQFIRHPGLTRRQFKALEGALQFDRRARTPSVARFMEAFRGKPAVRAVSRAWLGGIVAAVLVAAVLFFGRAPLATVGRSPAPPPKPGELFRDCPTCPLMMAIPAGSFDQGTATAAGRSPFEAPRHAVDIDAPFGMGVHEVTVGEFAEFADATGLASAGCEVYEGEWRIEATRSWRDPGFAQTSTHPASCVSWQDASAYAVWLTQKTGQAYRLPTASEWEYATRGGADIETPWGKDANAACKSANIADLAAAKRYPGWTAQPCDDGYVNSAPVGTYSANAFGLKDTLGNVFEWVEDCWFKDYVDAPDDGSARTDGPCKERELRGGSWFTTPDHLRAQYRNRFEPAYRSNSIGFRVVRRIDK